ncbi:hypothetical protein G647_08012 [Cladophialophora carrionii CBS 160.54]|uniref:Uncharacterized protein n=1 Tax=Cladophialophora carrionii CBS 160.54 TaxID=1279043 RepID=V9D467_9EURO|nr:uncharacterized protein G647_08012 [Cladophialophora carrionii CBS 160.54]ETI21665.1 hypothetical protein G647_08012 [Cladophialophora carrionii CBS 160.54]
MSDGKIVSSLSWLSTRLAGSLFKDKYTLGQIVADIVSLGAIISLWVVTRGPRQIFDVNPQSARGLLIGISALILWYVVTIIDLFLHEARISVPYNYFFIDVPILALKLCGEGFLVATTYRIVVLHLQQQTRKAKVALVLGEVLILALLVTAMYSLGSLIARQIVWLQLADEKTRNSFAWPQRKLEAAFHCIQFCMGLIATVFAGINAWMIHQAHGKLTAITHRLFWAALSLWIWCTSEMVFVLKYQLGQHLPAKNTGLARDTIYDFFLLASLILLAFDWKSNNKQLSGNRAGLPPHLRPLLADMTAACRAHIVEQLRTRTNDLEKPPPMADLIRDLRRNPSAAFRGDIVEDRRRLDVQALRMLDERYRAYVTELHTRYGDLRCTRVAREV